MGIDVATIGCVGEPLAARIDMELSLRLDELATAEYVSRQPCTHQDNCAMVDCLFRHECISTVKEKGKRSNIQNIQNQVKNVQANESAKGSKHSYDFDLMETLLDFMDRHSHRQLACSFVTRRQSINFYYEWPLIIR